MTAFLCHVLQPSHLKTVLFSNPRVVSSLTPLWDTYTDCQAYTRGCMQHSPDIGSIAHCNLVNTTPYQVHVDHCACSIVYPWIVSCALQPFLRKHFEQYTYRRKVTGKGLPGPLSDWPTLSCTDSWLLIKRVEVCLSSFTQTGCHVIFTISCIYTLFYCRLNLNPFLTANTCTFEAVLSSTSGVGAVNQAIGDINISREGTSKIIFFHIIL